MLSCVQFFATPWTVSRQGPLSIGFPRQEYWSGFPFPPPGDVPDPGIEPKFLVSPPSAGDFFFPFTTEPTEKPKEMLSYENKIITAKSGNYCQKIQILQCERNLINCFSQTT